LSSFGQGSTGAAIALAFAFMVLILLSSLFSHWAPGRLVDWGMALALGLDGPARWGAVLVTVVLCLGAVGLASWALRRQEF
jgi:hypothetical protein